MKKLKTFIHFGIILLFLFGCNSTKTDNTKKLTDFKSNESFLMKSIDSHEKYKEIRNSEFKVELIDFCNSNVNCGIMAFASLSTVKILEGKYISDTIVVAELCKKINYDKNKTYVLKYESAPNFGVSLCYGNTYNSDYNNKTENKYYLTFGSLVEKNSEKY